MHLPGPHYITTNRLILRFCFIDWISQVKWSILRPEDPAMAGAVEYHCSIVSPSSNNQFLARPHSQPPFIGHCMTHHYITPLLYNCFSGNWNDHQHFLLLTLSLVQNFISSSSIHWVSPDLRPKVVVGGVSPIPLYCDPGQSWGNNQTIKYYEWLYCCNNDPRPDPI